MASMEMLARQQEIERRRENELHKVALGIREEQFARGLQDIQACFGRYAQVFNDDLTHLEKTAKTMRRTRRHLRTELITRMKKKELEMEDMLSSSESGAEEFSSGKVDSDVASSSMKEEEKKHNQSSQKKPRPQLLPAIFDEEQKSLSEQIQAPKPESGNGALALPEEEEKSEHEEEDCSGMPRMALGGVPLNTNGEPLDLTTTGKWESEYDDDTDSRVSLLVIISRR